MTPEETNLEVLRLWTNTWTWRQFRLAHARHASYILYFTPDRSMDDPDGDYVFSSDNDEVLKLAAERYQECNRLLALTGGDEVQHCGHRAIIADAYDRVNDVSLRIAYHWKVTWTQKCRFIGATGSGQPEILGSAPSLANL